MTMGTNERNRYIKELLNGTLASIKTVVPIEHQISKPELLGQELSLQFGVLIGIRGDIKGNLVLAGETTTFASVGQTMFGMPLEGEMLTSFSGELGNMIAGSLSTNIVQSGIKTDITSPTMLQGDVQLSGYENAIKLTASFNQAGNMDIYFLLD